MPDHGPAIPHQFETLEQKHEIATLGMWLFLATEVLLFGGLFFGYAAYRAAYPDIFAEASQHLRMWLATANTAILLTSSLTMALAVHAAQHGNRKRLTILLVLTMLFGLAFLGIKGVEYYIEYLENLVPLTGFTFEYEGTSPQIAALFYQLYFVMTGLHAVHLIIGIGIVAGTAVLAWRGRFTAETYEPVEVVGLYWHFIDVVWIFLFPLLYLIG